MKNRRMLITLVASTLLFLSCQKDKLFSINSRTESFTIKCDENLTLQLSNGDLVKISENTFSCNQEKFFTLKINTVKTKREILLSKLQTLDNKNGILESGGMIKLDYPEEISINKNNPVLYESKSNYYFPKMQSYVLDIKTNKWIPTNDKLIFENIEQIELGKSLYSSHCEQCHGKQLDKDLTGPSLGRVGEHRSMDWLIEFTINSQAMIAKNDSLAVCLWHRWKPTIMTSNTELDTSEILAIYRYIQNESEVQNISKNRSNFECKIDTDRLRRDSIKQIFYAKQHEKYLDLISTGNISFEPIEYDSNFINVIQLIRSPRWHNIDRQVETDIKIKNPRLKIINRNEYTNVVAMVDNFNIALQFTYNEDEGDYFLLSGSDTIDWNSKNKNIYIIAYNQNGPDITEGQILKVRLDENNNNISLKLEKTTTAKFDLKLFDAGMK